LIPIFSANKLEKVLLFTEKKNQEIPLSHNEVNELVDLLNQNELNNEEKSQFLQNQNILTKLIILS
jgi:hypothetical protein